MRLAYILIVMTVSMPAGLAQENGQPSGPSPSPAEKLPRKINTRHLPNAYRLHDRVISGGEPDSEAAFRELKALGVKTIISVDGARPRVELARKYGLRYVHLPHGYDGVPVPRARELAKAVRDLPGPIYIHCHHGKHRSPAAAAVACVGAGLLKPTAAVSVLHVAGTSRHYRGLYASARQARRFDDALLDALKVEFPERADVPPMAKAMVAIEHTFDHLRTIQEAGWKRPAAHPDLDPAHEALLLREHFTELLRTDAAQEQPALFRQMLRTSRQAASKLEAGLRNRTDSGRPVPETITRSFKAISDNCKACHVRFRDVPTDMVLP